MLKRTSRFSMAVVALLALAALSGVAARSAPAQHPGEEPAPGIESPAEKGEPAGEEAEENVDAANASRAWALAIAICVAIGIPCLGAAYAVGKVGAASLGAASEKPELLARSLLFVALAEGIAIYGLLIAILLWLKL
jgi:V/A-type H+-transporting ATPase subunit K